MHFSSILDALILGIVEGVTEFIPVSSTAHLLLAGRILGFDNAGKAFEVLIQFGAILALLSVYAGRLATLIADLPRDRRTQRFALGVVVAFLPAAIVGVFFHKYITEVLFNAPVLICIALIAGGIVLLFIDRLPGTPRVRDIMNYPIRFCFGIGLFQVLSLIPGVSRSGATIVGGMLLGADKRSAAEFSFFLAIPTMLGAFVFDLYENWSSIDASAALVIAVSFVAAFVSALFVVRSFLGFVSQYGLAPFGWWRIVVGVAGLLILLVFSGTPAPKTVASGDAPALELAVGAIAPKVGGQDRREAGGIALEDGKRAQVAQGRV
jgi:undecaprenyl-diphosphatase